jgi:hypothetical protein
MRSEILRDILREYPVIIELLSLVVWFIIFLGSVKNIKITKKLKKQYGTDTVTKETTKELLDELTATKRFVFIGFITIMVMRIIGVIIYID